MPRRLVPAAILLALASAVPARAEPDAARGAAVSPPITEVSDDEFLKAHPVGEPFTVQVDGKEESFLGKVRSAYFEWVYGKQEGGKLTSYSVAYRSEPEIQLTSGSQRASLRPSRVRTHLAPALERDYRATDRDAPDAVRERLEKEPGPVHVAEYRLEAGKTYFALVHEDSYHLPPQGPGQRPRRATKLVLWLSDKPFADGKPQVEITPGYKGWTY
jgi:hypothetical protein